MFATFAPMILWFAHTILCFAPMIAAFALGIFSKTHQSSLTLNEGFFLKSPRPSLPLKRAPPLPPTLSPQERGGNRSYSSL